MWASLLFKGRAKFNYFICRVAHESAPGIKLLPWHTTSHHHLPVYWSGTSTINNNKSELRESNQMMRESVEHQKKKKMEELVSRSETLSLSPCSVIMEMPFLFLLAAVMKELCWHLVDGQCHCLRALLSCKDGRTADRIRSTLCLSVIICGCLLEDCVGCRCVASSNICKCDVMRMNTLAGRFYFYSLF